MIFGALLNPASSSINATGTGNATTRGVAALAHQPNESTVAQRDNVLVLHGLATP